MRLLNRKVFWVLYFGILSSVVQAAEKKDPYMEALTILTRNCAGCHQAADHPGALFLNRESLSEVATLSLVIKLIKTSQMPPAHKDFAKTPDGKKLLKWLETELTTKEKK